MRMKNLTVFLFLFVAACSGSSKNAASNEPTVPIEKIEEIEGWIRLKAISTAPNQKVDIATGTADVRLTSGANGFAIPTARYRQNAKEDYAEIELGTKLQVSAPPQTVGPAIYDKTTLPARAAEKCAGKATLNVPVWHGCGPIACDGSGEIIGVGCGGWTAANAPK
jgi:hypothetical protein